MKSGTTHIPFDEGFIVKTGVIRVTDPCYDPSTTDSIKKIEVLNGRWLAAVEMLRDSALGGPRVAALTIHHETLDRRQIHFLQREDAVIGVDSGQCGFFDEGEYLSIPTTRYEEICNLTLGDTCGGIIDCGAVSSSGYGDGGYHLFLQKDKEGNVVAARIVFIDEDEDEIDEDEDDEIAPEDEEDDED